MIHTSAMINHNVKIGNNTLVGACLQFHDVRIQQWQAILPEEEVKLWKSY